VPNATQPAARRRRTAARAIQPVRIVLRGLVLGLLVWLGLFVLSYGVLQGAASDGPVRWLPGGGSRDAVAFPLFLIGGVVVAALRSSARAQRHGAYLGSVENARLLAAEARRPENAVRFDRVVEESARRQRPLAQPGE
jgi:hypothetical protein